MRGWGAGRVFKSPPPAPGPRPPAPGPRPGPGLGPGPDPGLDPGAAGCEVGQSHTAGVRGGDSERNILYTAKIDGMRVRERQMTVFKDLFWLRPLVHK